MSIRWLERKPAPTFIVFGTKLRRRFGYNGELFSDVNGGSRAARGLCGWLDFHNISNPFQPSSRRPCYLIRLLFFGISRLPAMLRFYGFWATETRCVNIPLFRFFLRIHGFKPWALPMADAYRGAVLLHRSSLRFAFLSYSPILCMYQYRRVHRVCIMYHQVSQYNRQSQVIRRLMEMTNTLGHVIIYNWNVFYTTMLKI